MAWKKLVLTGSLFNLAYTGELHWDESELDEYVTACMTQWGIPGVAIGIVREGDVVMSKGWGIRGVDQAEPIDAQTLFPIASGTKAFTAALLGIGVDEGKLAWDDPLTQYLPQLQFYHPHLTETLSIRDALCHRSGMVCVERLWDQTDYTSDEILYRLRFAKPQWELRSRFTYNNILYSALGKVAESIFQQTWDHLIKSRILQPLGMTATVTHLLDERDHNNIASSHTSYQNQLVATRWLNYDNCRPAISMFSNVTDLLKWVCFHLECGGEGQPQPLKKQTIAQMHHPQIALDDPSWQGYFPDSSMVTYGLGWVVHTYQGHTIVEHSGSVPGSSSLVAFLPEEKTGIVILTNRDSAIFFPRVIFYHLLNANMDWNQVFFDLFNRYKEQLRQEERKFEQSRQENTVPRLPLTAYTGEYQNKLYGDIRVEYSDESNMAVECFLPDRNRDHCLQLQSRLCRGILEHWHGDTFRLLPERIHSEFHESLYVTFAFNAQGRIDRLTMETVPGQNVIEWIVPKKLQEGH